MFAVFDTETRGLFGGIFKVGYYRDGEYFTFNTGKEFFRKLLEDCSLYEEIRVYAFNLDFDLSKLVKEVKNIKFDFDNSLIISGKFHVAKIEGYNLYLHDLQPLVNSSLHDACKSFALTTKKIKLQEDDLEEYFNTVSPDDEEFLEYLKADCISTYELLLKLQELGGLSDEEFIKCPTLPSLAMRLYKKKYPEEFEFIKKSTMTKEQEDVIRRAYFGGRVEVFKPLLKTQAYHYDVNSLYPSVMEDFAFPVGRISASKNGLPQESMQELFKNLQHFNFYYFLECKVEVPQMAYPPLPHRHVLSNRLLFPVGIFSGTWTKTEIEYALSCGVKILEFKKFYWWEKSAKIFKGFIEEFKQMKLTSEGAKKNFAKLIQNSLYGKFGMRRERITYARYDLKKYEKMENEGKTVVKVIIKNQDIMMYKKLFFTDYIRPQFAAIITSLARVELISAIHKLEKVKKDCIYYIDTDSIITDQKMVCKDVHEKEYGKWKIEREIIEGIFVLPKVYCEKEADGKEILKSKGIIKQHLKKTTYNDYLTYYEAMTKGENLELYGESEKYYGRQKLMYSLLKHSDIDKKVLLKKTFLFATAFLKREYDYQNNISYPLYINEDELQDEEYQNLRESIYKKISYEERRNFRKVILTHGGINDNDFELLPKWCKRKKGLSLDEVLSELWDSGYCYTDTNDLYIALWQN